MEDTRLALDGFDPISFFEGASPKRGKMEFKLDHHGKIYFFLNGENRGRFQRNPGSFLPQLGGYCALTCAAFGGLEPGLTEHRTIVAGRLYLFSSSGAKSFWEKLPFLARWGEFFYERKFKIKVKG